MPQSKNSAGRNKGKKYIKLTGDEIATPEAEKRARDFMRWFGAMYHSGTSRGIRDFDNDIATDTMLKVYNDICYKDVRVQNYRAYFTCAYHTTKLQRNISASAKIKTHVPIDVALDVAAPDFDYELYEEIGEQINSEILEYVREKYNPMEISIFEIYLGLQPDISYPIMANMLGISEARIYNIVSAIKRDLKENYTERRNHLRSTLE